MIRATHIHYVVDGVSSPITVYSVEHDAAGNITVHTYIGAFHYNSMSEQWVHSPNGMRQVSYSNVPDDVVSMLERVRGELPPFPYVERAVGHERLDNQPI